MSALAWLESTAASEWVRGSPSLFAFPGILSCHTVGMGLAAGINAAIAIRILGAKRGVFYRPVKQQLTLRLDADVVAWFKSHTKSREGYQTRINRALREYVQGQTSRSRRSRA